jgi:outer membrane biosynthesis protein TonB
MTTADIMVASQWRGSRTLEEQEYDARAILLALLAAILIHLLVALSLALFGGFFSPRLPAEDEPVQLTLVASPLAPKNSAFIETGESKKSVEPPKEKTFESNANSIGASELAAAGTLPLPSQTGKDRPFVDFDTQPYSLETKGAQPQPSAAPQKNASRQAASSPLTAAEQFALLSTRSGPANERSTEAGSMRSAYRPLKERTHVSGSITNRGSSSVNALGTPLGRYEKIVRDAIGSRWYAYVDQKRDLITIGTLQLQFYIDRSGRVKDLKITQNSNNEAFANICLQSVMEANLPPIPNDVAGALPPEGLEADETFIIYP